MSNRVRIIAIVIILLIAAVLLVRWGGGFSNPVVIEDNPATETTSSELLVSVMDAGQAQCVVVIPPDGPAMVIDAGRSASRIEDQVVPYLRDHGVDQLAYVIMSHPDQDHVGGLPALLRAMPVEAFVDPVIPSTNQSYLETLQIVDNLGIEAIKGRRGMSFDLGNGVTAEILWPVDPLIESGGEIETNPNSIVVMLRYGTFSMLIPGDADRRAETEMLKLGTDEQLQANVLVLGHHGSNTSSSGNFLDAVRPQVAIASAGFENSYGHPHPEVLRRLRLRAISIYRTDLDGTIEVRSDGQGFDVTSLGTERD